MDRLRSLCARTVARVRKLFEKPVEVVEPEYEPPAEAVAKVQQILKMGEPVQRVSDFKMHRQGLRNTLHDMPAAPPQSAYGKERHWFDKADYQAKVGSASNTWNRLEAFLASTDPNQLSTLDPNWSKSLLESGDDNRPQPKKQVDSLPKIRRPAANQECQPVNEKQLFQEGLLSESISGVR